MSESMVRKVAHAISTEVIGELDATYLVAARAAIEAMREPDKAMVDRAWELLRSNLRHEEVYQHMIAAALSEDEGKGSANARD